MNEPITDVWQLPDDQRQLVEDELNRSERLLWLGKPNPNAFMWTALPVVLFAIPWTLFSMFWIAGAAGFKIPDFQKGFDFFPLFGLPFFFIGIGMLTTPYWVRRSARKTVYAITTDRVLIFAQKLQGVEVHSMRPDQLGELKRVQKSDGSGDLIFRNFATILKETVNASNNQIPSQMPAGFYAIAEVKKVEQIVQALIENHSRQQESLEESN